MADLRCPMCGKLNPETNAECQHCGSRLKPLVVSGDAPGPTDQTLVSQPPARGPAADQTLISRPAVKGPADQTLISRPAKPPPPVSSLDATMLRRSLRDSWESQPPVEPEAEEPEEPAVPEPPPAQGAEESPGWLQRLRSQTGSPRARPPARDAGRMAALSPPPAAPSPPPKPPPPETTGRRSTGDLFRSLRTAAMKGSKEPEPEPAAMPSEEVPDWLDSLRKHSAAPSEPERAEPTPEVVPSISEMPNWLQSLRDHAAVPTPEAEHAAAAAEPEPPAEAPPSAPPASSAGRREDKPGLAGAEIPDWLLASRPAEPSPDQPTLLGKSEADADDLASTWTPAAAEDIPDWLKPMESSAAGVTAVEDLSDLPDWLRSIGGPEPDAGVPEAAVPAPEIPDWLRSEQVEDSAAPTPAGKLPDWLDALPPVTPQFAAPAEPAPPLEAEAPAERESVDLSPPAWLSMLGAPAAETPPPAKSLDRDVGREDFDAASPEAPFAEASPAAAEAETLPSELPAWLDALRPSGAAPDVSLPDLPQAAQPPVAAPYAPATVSRSAPAPAPGTAAEDLERATLPSWLEAMRPIPIARPTSSTSPDYEETTGPLAGMKGVLAAEPAIALPSIRLSAATQPVVSETHGAQARALEALIKEEAAPRAAVRKAGARPILALLERWIVFTVLVVAVFAPFILDSPVPTFALPSRSPAATIAARDTVAGLPTDRPVLVAFEYDPGAAGEMDLLAGALLSHLSGRGLRVAAISTRPLGPALAQAALERGLTGGQGVPTERLYVNLGYLPGDMMGLPVFAIDPRSVATDDFSAPVGEAPEPDVWNSVVLGNVHSLADFGLIAVISNSPEIARMWIEQLAASRAGADGSPHPPMIALVSASAEPLVQPYYLKGNPGSPLQGLVSGQFGATSYLQLAGAEAAPLGVEAAGVAGRRWDGQAFGLLAAAAIIVVGGLIFGSFGLLQRRGANTT